MCGLKHVVVTDIRKEAALVKQCSVIADIGHIAPEGSKVRMSLDVSLCLDEAEDALVVGLRVLQVGVRIGPFGEPERRVGEGCRELVVSVVESGALDRGEEWTVPVEGDEVNVAAHAKLEELLKPSDVEGDGWSSQVDPVLHLRIGELRIRSMGVVVVPGYRRARLDPGGVVSHHTVESNKPALSLWRRDVGDGWYSDTD